MTPVADFRRMSLMPSSYAVTRSQSDTSYEGLAAVLADKRRRASEWGTGANDKKMVLRPLQLNSDHNGLLQRRMSKASPRTSPSSSTTNAFEQSRDGVTRSYSVKSVKKIAEARQRNRGSSIPSESTNSGGAKVKERTVSNRSLPLPGDESEYMRLRNFSVTSKGVINRGDSFRSKSSPHVPGLKSNDDEAPSAASTPVSEGVPSPVKDEPMPFPPFRTPYKILLLGGHGVGKTSMWKQFKTSEYICACDFAHDQDIDRTVTIILNDEEAQMEFQEEEFQDRKGYSSKFDNTDLDAFVIVYSVTDRKTFSQAKQILSSVEGYVDLKAVILVGNKTDLARLRTVSTDEGKSLAKDKGCKFIETSVAINHQVDELLVGTLTQIRMKAKVNEKLRKKRESQGSNRRSSIYSGSKASGVLKKILRRACLKSKSCDNLHVL